MATLSSGKRFALKIFRRHLLIFHKESLRLFALPLVSSNSKADIPNVEDSSEIPQCGFGDEYLTPCMR